MNIFCSGIGGIGLSAYAAYQRASGHTVSGSDRAKTPLISDLKKQGIAVTYKQDGSAVPNDTELFVYTLALAEDHPDRERAKKNGIPQKTYFEALGDLIRLSEKPLIAVCGTHGKSSTTAMAAKMLIDAGRDPSVIVGTKTKDLGGRNWRKGEGDNFLVEACEYHRSFLHLAPQIILLTNADGDHFDAFKDMKDYESAFQEFIRKLPSNGALITHVTDKKLRGILEEAKKKGIRIIDADIFSAPKVGVPGKHMQENAKLVLALAELLGVKGAEKSLAEYSGSWRRMEVKGETPEGVLIMDDYGHHPTEVRATLNALREGYPERRIVCVFQPHTHDRTKKLYGDFLTAFSDADILVIPNIYDARPKEGELRVEVTKLIADIAKTSEVEAFDGESLEATSKLLKEHILQRGDLLVTMGAGDVGKVAEMLL